MEASNSLLYLDPQGRTKAASSSCSFTKSDLESQGYPDLVFSLTESELRSDSATMASILDESGIGTR
ncbi:hypothetical protein CEP53_013063 [Fusarium sp. AF-6]|nr:hypothetical protein CEP53_013063 [Fusarium sp. AF-6]